MHLVLRSTRATGDWSFRKGKNPEKIRAITKKFGVKYGVRIHSIANVGKQARSRWP